MWRLGFYVQEKPSALIVGKVGGLRLEQGSNSGEPGETRFRIPSLPRTKTKDEGKTHHVAR